jgi:hypothetical protein
MEEGSVTLIEAVAAVLLGLGSLLILRAVWQADRSDVPAAPQTPALASLRGLERPKAAESWQRLAA